MMSEAVAVALIVAIPPTLAAVAALIVSTKNRAETKEVHLSLNSRLDQLIKVTRSDAIHEGRKAESDDRDKKNQY